MQLFFRHVESKYQTDRIFICSAVRANSAVLGLLPQSIQDDAAFMAIANSYAPAEGPIDEGATSGEKRKGEDLDHVVPDLGDNTKKAREE